jgi:hypothetical protein
MAEKKMVENKLEETSKLIKYLDSTDYSPSTILWQYFTDADDWRLIIAGKAFDQHLPKNELLAYKIISEALKSENIAEISMADIMIIKTTNSMLYIPNSLFRTDPKGIGRFYFQNNTVNGVFIKEMIIIRSFREK